jgi:hypothetical protein
MSLALSTALRAFLWNGGSISRALTGGVLKIYSGTQPDTADHAATGALLATLTDNKGAHTNEVAATGTITITGSDVSSGTITSLTIDGEEMLWANVTASGRGALASALRDHLAYSLVNTDFVVSFDGDYEITLTCKPGCGTQWNTAEIICTVTTLGATEVDFSGGVASVNGLKVGQSLLNGTVWAEFGKYLSQTWSGDGVAAGNAGWFRFYGPFADAGADDTSFQYFRLDGSVGLSGTNMTVDDIAISIGEAVSCGQFNPGSENGPTF